MNIYNIIAAAINKLQQDRKIKDTLFKLITKNLKSPLSIELFVNTYINSLEKIKSTYKLNIAIPLTEEVIDLIKSQIKPTLNILLTELKTENISERNLTKVLIQRIKEFNFPFWNTYCLHVNNLFLFSKNILSENIDYKHAVANAEIIHETLDKYKTKQINNVEDLVAVFIAVVSKLDKKDYSKQFNVFVKNISKALNSVQMANTFSQTFLEKDTFFYKKLVNLVKQYINQNALQELSSANLEPLIEDNSEAISLWLKDKISTLEIKEDNYNILQYMKVLKFNSLLILNCASNNNKFEQKIKTKMQQLYRKLGNVEIIPIEEIANHNELKKDDTFFVSGLSRKKRASALVDFKGELIGEPSDLSHQAIMRRVVEKEKRYTYEDVQAWLEDRGRTAVVIHSFIDMEEIKNHCLNDSKHNFEKVIYYSPKDHSADGSNVNKMIMAKRNMNRSSMQKPIKRLLRCEYLIHEAASNKYVELYIDSRKRGFTIQNVIDRVDTKIIPEDAIATLFDRANYFNQNSDRAEYAKNYLQQIISNPTKNIFYNKIKILGINLYPVQWKQISGFNVFNAFFDHKFDVESKIRDKLFNKFSKRIDRVIKDDPQIATAKGNVKLSQLNAKEDIRSLALLLILGTEINDDANANPERYVIPYAEKLRIRIRGQNTAQKIIMYHDQEYTFEALATLVNKATGLNINRGTINSAYNYIKGKFKNLPETEKQEAINKDFSKYVDELIRKKQYKNERKVTINGKLMSLTDAAEQTKFSYTALITKRKKIKEQISVEHPDWTIDQIEEECTKRLSKELEAIINGKAIKSGKQIFTINGIDYTIPQIAKYILKYDYSSVSVKYNNLIKEKGELEGNKEFTRLVQQEIDHPGTTFLAKGMRKSLKPTVSHVLTIGNETKTLRDWSRDERVKLYSSTPHCIDDIYNQAVSKGVSSTEAMERAKNIVERMLAKRPAMRLIPIQINGTWQCKTKTTWVRELAKFVTGSLQDYNMDDFQIKCQEIVDKLYTNCTIDGSTELIKDWLDLLELNNVDNYKLLSKYTIDEIQLHIIDAVSKM